MREGRNFGMLYMWRHHNSTPKYLHTAQRQGFLAGACEKAFTAADQLNAIELLGGL